MLDLFSAVGMGLAILLPLANPLTATALYLGLSGGMSKQFKKKQAFLAAVYVFLILAITWYAGQVVMATFGISIPGLRMSGGLIVAFIGFTMLFPFNKESDNIDCDEIKKEDNIAFVPLAMPGTAGPGTMAVVISAASLPSPEFPSWVLFVAPSIVFFITAFFLYVCLRCSGVINKYLGKNGIDAISRVMGFLLVCMGVQFVINAVFELISMK